MAKCPNCKSDIAWDVPICPGCTAVFSLDSVWRPVPDNDEEAESLANKYAAQRQPDEALSVGGGLWIAFKLCLSLILVLLAVFFGVMAFRGPRVDWTVLGFLGLFIFLAALPWVDFVGRSRALALTIVVFALGTGAMARSYLNGGTPLPLSCLGRRPLSCEFQNTLYALGGAEAVAALWFTVAATLLYVAWQIFRRARQTPQRKARV